MPCNGRRFSLSSASHSSAFVFPVRAFPLFRFEHYLQFTGVLQKIASVLPRGDCNLSVDQLARRGRVDRRPERGLPRPDVFLSRPGLRRLGHGRCDATLRATSTASYSTDTSGATSRRRTRTASAASFPAITSVLFGVLAGYMLRLELRATHRARWMLASGCVLVLTGLALSNWVPISKPLWTTSFAVLMAGLSSAAMAFWIWICDVRDWSRWLKPFEIFGMNAIAAYVISVAGRNVAKVHVFGKTSVRRPVPGNRKSRECIIDLRGSARPRRLRRRLVDVPAPLVPAHLKLSSRQAARPSCQRPEGPPRPRSLRRRPGSPLRPRSGARRHRAL